MSYSKRSEFFDKYRKLCEEYRCYVDTGYAKPMYIMEFIHEVDEMYLKTLEKLENDLG